jgi:hypothetical protein
MRQGIDALAVDVLIALGECDAAERRAGQLLQTMIDREQLSLRQRSPGSAAPSPSGATRLAQRAQPDETASRCRVLATATADARPSSDCVEPTDRQAEPHVLKDA